MQRLIDLRVGRLLCPGAFFRPATRLWRNWRTRRVKNKAAVFLLEGRGFSLSPQSTYSVGRKRQYGQQMVSKR